MPLSRAKGPFVTLNFSGHNWPFSHRGGSCFPAKPYFMSHETSGEARPASFEQEWKRLGPQVAQRLAKQGIARDLVEDVTQETGIRLYQRWEHIDLSKPLLPLAHRIARNRLVDHVRADARLHLEPSPVSTTRSDLTEERALSRMQLDAAVRALPKLSDRYRRLLLDDGRRASGVPSSTADRTARTRARRSLKALMERTSGIAVVPVRGMLRSLTEHAKRARNTLAHVDANLLANALVGAVILITSVPLANLERHTDVESAPHLIAAGGNDRDGAAQARASTSVGSEPNHRSSTDDMADGRPSPHEPKRLLPGDPSTHVHALLGPKGLYYEGRHSVTPGDERIEWRYKIRTRNPRCVERAYSAELTTDCSGGQAPRGYVEMENDGRTERVDYGKDTR